MTALRDQNADLTADLEDAEARLKAQRANSSSFDASVSTADPQGRAAVARERRLREELSVARRQRQEAESLLLSRDAAAVEMRFDLEAADLEKQRLVARIKELEAARLQPQGARGGTSMSGVTAVGAKGGKGQREAELEGVVEAMKKLLDKLKSENDRLRRGEKDSPGPGSGPAPGPVDWSKKLGAERRRAEKAEEEVKQLQQRSKNLEESSAREKQRLQLQQQQSNSLRKQLQTKEDQITEFRARAEDAEAKAARLEAQLQLQIQSQSQSQSEQQQQQARQVQQWQEQVRRAEGQITDLLRDKQVLQSEVTRLERQAQLAQTQRSSSSAAAADAGGGTGTAELARLREENRKLKMELSAFDLDFFEEIENLKYAHAEAIRKLRSYESSAGSRGER